MTPPRTLVQLTAPGSGGVRDYLECLQGCWTASGIDNRVITMAHADAQAEPLAARLQKIIKASGRPCTLLLHFSGYGFHPRGVCSWLAREIETTRRQLGGQVLIVTLFHELYASGGPLWKSAFWLSRWQASIAARLARASDRLWTNTEAHARWLRNLIGDARPLAVWPVFSTVGEPALAPSALHARTVRMVAFGLQRTRHRALALLQPHATALRRHGVAELVEVGAGEPFAWPASDLPHRYAGRLGTVELRRLLEDSTFGLIDYPLHNIGKSTVFAAYAAHGLVTLNTAVDVNCGDTAQLNGQLVTLTCIPTALEGAGGSPDAHTLASQQSMADACRRWYGHHTLSLQANALAAFCDAVAAGSPAQAA
jgi:hypothetical protein